MKHLTHRTEQRDMDDSFVYTSMPGYTGPVLPLQNMFAFMAGMAA